MVFAINEIAQSPAILPNITLGFQAYDSCMVIQQSLEGALHAVTGRGMVVPNYQCFLGVPLSAIIGHSTSTHSILLAQVLGLLWYPQVTYINTFFKFWSEFDTLLNTSFKIRFHIREKNKKKTNIIFTQGILWFIVIKNVLSFQSSVTVIF